jgi:serine/threonine-protein kinase
MDQPERAATEFRNAIGLLESRLEEDPDDYRMYRSLGLAHAGLGIKEKAISEGEHGIRLMPMSKDAPKAFYTLGDLALIYTMVGEYEKAIDQIEYLLSIPSQLTLQMLRVDPVWNPLREHPRFRRLLEEDKQYIG